MKRTDATFVHFPGSCRVCVLSLSSHAATRDTKRTRTLEVCMIRISPWNRRTLCYPHGQQRIGGQPFLDLLSVWR